MKQLFGFLLRIVVFVALALWLADRPGTAHIVWHDYVIDTSAAFLGLSALAVGFVFYLLFRLWHLVRHGPERWRLQHKLQKLRRGQEHITKGLIAIAGGNAAEAGRFAVNARKLLGVTPATQLLQAQAAQLAGDHRAAQEIFGTLAANADSAVLGYRGLIMEARRMQDWTEMERLAEKLRETKPNTPWLNLIRFELLARQQKWGEAAAVLDRVVAARLLEPVHSKQHRAAVLVAQSHLEAGENNIEKSLQSAEQAMKQDPHFLPATINLAQRQMAAGHARAAHRTIDKGWSRTPHPQLAIIYLEGKDDPLNAYKHIERLCRSNEEDPISRLILAEAALAADLWGEARRHLIGLVSHGQTTQSAYRLLARLERRESADEQAALQWLTKAMEAPLDAAWLCRACSGAHEEWQAICKHCGSFNTLDWGRPGARRAHSALPALHVPNWLD